VLQTGGARVRIISGLLATIVLISTASFAAAQPAPGGRSIEELRTRHLQIARQAMREAVRKTLLDAIGAEQSQAYEFHVTFDTRTAGVTGPAAARERFPELMTIIPQYQFRELVVGDDVPCHWPWQVSSCVL
jgi:hypothetical protein